MDKSKITRSSFRSLDSLCKSLQKMDGKEGSAAIKAPSATTCSTKNQEAGNESLKSKIISFWKFYRADSAKVIYALKAGSATLLSSLLILFRAPYEKIGLNIIWAILSVVLMFEYTVGATFKRGFSRAVGSLLAAALAVGVGDLAICFGQVAEPFVIGFSIFLIGTIASLMKFWPSLVPYEYCFRVINFTYCLIVVSGLRLGGPTGTALQRLYLVAIGGAVAVFVNVLIFPNWAGEQLHKELAKSFESVADSLEECVKKYLENEGPEHLKTKTDYDEEPVYRKCRDILNSSEKLDALVQSAEWEPPHGRFRHGFKAWSGYVKVGAMLRHCTYEVMALHGALYSEFQAPLDLPMAIRTDIRDAAARAAELVRSLGKEISDMERRSSKVHLMRKVQSSGKKLDDAIKFQSSLLESQGNHLKITRKPLRRSNSWPEVKICESVGRLDITAALSVAAFGSPLVEFIARLEQLVEAVEELGGRAKFKNE